MKMAIYSDMRALIDTEGDVAVEFRRVVYDVEAAAAGIRRSELPDTFAAEIQRGGAQALVRSPMDP
jgi:hypothetical protein